MNLSSLTDIRRLRIIFLLSEILRPKSCRYAKYAEHSRRSNGAIAGAIRCYIVPFVVRWQEELGVPGGHIGQEYQRPQHILVCVHRDQV